MGQFDWFKSIGATDQAVATLNDQPHLFTTLVAVVIGLLAEVALLWLIHWATAKPSSSSSKNPSKSSWFKLLPMKKKNNDNVRRRVGS